MRQENCWDSNLRRNDSNSFDAIRLVLAVLVVLTHSFFLVDGNSSRDPLAVLSSQRLDCGQVAVFMFFALSGFLVTRSLVQTENTFRFLTKRFARVLPGFLTASLVGWLLLGPLMASNISSYFQNQDWKRLLLTAASLRQANVSGVLDENVLHLVHGTLWTIKYEFDCYLLLAGLGTLGLLLEGKRLLTFGLISVLLFISNVYQMPKIDHGFAAILISSPDKWNRLFPFFFVGAAFYVYREYIPKSSVIFIGCLVGLVISISTESIYLIVLTCGTYALLYMALSISVDLEFRGRKIDLSYGIYLYGWPIQQAIIYFFDPGISPIKLFFGALTISFPVAWLSWTVVEAPCLRLAKRDRS